MSFELQEEDQTQLSVSLVWRLSPSDHLSIFSAKCSTCELQYLMCACKMTNLLTNHFLVQKQLEPG